MASVTDFREDTQAYLAASLVAHLPAANWLGRKVETVPENRDGLGCVWLGPVREYPEDVQMQTVTLGCRVFKRFQQRFDPEVQGVDSAPYEELLEAIQVALQLRQATRVVGGVQEYGLGPDFCRMTGGEPDLDRQMVECEIVGYMLNPGVLVVP